MSAVPALDLALVIPVRDDEAGLARLLGRARASGLFSQIVVVDDGSSPAVPEAGDITLLRNERARGGGAARDQGLEAVRADYVLFFDSDDLITDELRYLVADLARAAHEAPFDLCLFKYADGREARAGRWGQPGWDERFWTAAALGPRPLAEVPDAARPLLAQTANYPWNKIFRVAFLREHAIGGAPTKVHNDVPLHWRALVLAGRMLASDRICAWHEVRPKGSRLTNAMGAERLALFSALEPAAREVAARGEGDWQAAFARFSLGLADWVRDRIAPEHLDELARREAAFLNAHLLPWREALAEAEPDTLAELTRRAGAAR